MKRFVGLILAFLFVLPVFVACVNEDTDESSYNDELSSSCDFEFEISTTTFKANKINCAPVGDDIVLYTKDYRVHGRYSITVGVETSERTFVSVRAKYIQDEFEYEFDVIDITQDGINSVIPVNGFTLSIPTKMLDGVRLNVGQLIKAKDFESVCPALERTDLATITPDYLISTAIRRVSIVDPVDAFEENKIYYITEKSEGREIGVDNIAVTVKMTNKYSGDVISVAKIEKIEKVNKGEAIFVYTGEYNIAYAKHYFEKAERIAFSMLESCNSYSDTEAVVICDEIIKLNKDNYNVENIDKEGIYVFDSDYSSMVTPQIAMDRCDIIVVDGYVISIGEDQSRTLIPEGNGFVITLVGESLSKTSEFAIGKAVTTCYIDYAKIPDKYVKINNYYFSFDFQNATRAPEGVSVVYTPEFGAKTSTNQYGSEIVIVDGKVTEVNVGIGDSNIPENGYVLSIHKDSECYANVRKIKVGDNADISFSGNAYSITTLDISAINSTRHENTLILYQNKASTGTNPYGYEVVVDESGIAIQDSYNGNSKIPQNGFVLSGHGENKTALENAFAIGQKIFVDIKQKKAYLIKTPEHKQYAANYYFAEVSDKLSEAKKALLNIDYKNIDEQISLMQTVIDEAEQAFKAFDFQTAFEKADAVISTYNNLKYSFIESKGVENRAVWYRSTEKNDEQVKATLLKMKSLNVNALYIETWYEGYCIGAKVDVEGITTHSNNGGYDALEGFIRIGHELGIEVHAWVHNFFVGFYYKGGASYYNPTFDNYKDKYLKDINGKENFYYSANNNYFVFLNPYDRECRDLIISVYKQLVEKYDLDGLHLDYVRMPELNYGKDDFGYNDDIIEAFAKETGITTDPRTFVKNSTESKSWIQFRCDIITSFVGEVCEAVRKIENNIWISAATYPDLNMAKNEIFQDVRGIIEKGYLDEVFSMSYGVDSSTVSSSVKSYNSITEGKIFYSAGIAAFLETTKDNFAIQLEEVIKDGADGVSVFALNSITPENYQYAMTDGAFRNSSVQVNKFSVTAIAQMNFIKNKVDNLSDLYQNLDDADIAYVKEQCDELISFSETLNIETASISEKLSWCNKAMSKIAAVKTNILNQCGNDKETASVISEFESLEYWLKISALRLSSRK